jgi:hypothetical protein
MYNSEVQTQITIKPTIINKYAAFLKKTFVQLGENFRAGNIK